MEIKGFGLKATICQTKGYKNHFIVVALSFSAVQLTLAQLCTFLSQSSNSGRSAESMRAVTLCHNQSAATFTL